MIWWIAIAVWVVLAIVTYRAVDAIVDECLPQPWKQTGEGT